MGTCKRDWWKHCLVIGAYLHISLVGWVGIGAAVEAGGSQIEVDLRHFMDIVRSGRVYLDPNERFLGADQMVELYGADLIPVLAEYTSDPCDSVRGRANMILFKIGISTDDVEVRQEVVHKLLVRTQVEPCLDRFNGKLLLRFTSGDFSEESKQVLRRLLRESMEKGNVSKTVVLLVGVADLKSELPRLNTLINELEGPLRERHEKYLEECREALNSLPKRPEGVPPSHLKKVYEKNLKKQYWQHSVLWAALRARARMGVEEDIYRCIEMVESHPDEAYRAARLFKELSYVRQPQVVRYLAGYLENETLYPYLGPDVVRFTYGQCAAQALARMLRGFPVKERGTPDKETIAGCVQWLAEREQWDIIR